MEKNQKNNCNCGCNKLNKWLCYNTRIQDLNNITYIYLDNKQKQIFFKNWIPRFVIYTKDIIKNTTLIPPNFNYWDIIYISKYLKFSPLANLTFVTEDGKLEILTTCRMMQDISKNINISEIKELSNMLEDCEQEQFEIRLIYLLFYISKVVSLT